jgi:hypothetical protein
MICPFDWAGAPRSSQYTYVASIRTDVGFSTLSAIFFGPPAHDGSAQRRTAPTGAALVRALAAPMVVQ